MTARPESTQPRAGGWDRATALALLLPVLALAAPVPLALLAGDPQAELTGAGWTALLSLPLAILLVARGAAPAPRGLALLAGFAAAGALSLALFPAVDTLAADRAVALGLSGLVAFLGGAALGPAGRAWLLRGLVLASLAASLAALLGGAPWAGPLQNTGATSELALPGALIGAWLFATDRAPRPWGPPWRLAGAAALLAEAFFAGRAPVLTALVALTAVLSLGAALSPGRGDRRRLLALGGLALAALAAGWAARPGAFGAAGAPAASASGSGTDSAVDPDLVGLEVRRRIWSSLPALVLDHPWLGVGPGQFAAAYPPYRDPAEQRLSDTFLAGSASEVEHVHDDWLQGVVEVGLPGGALWILFLLLALARAAAGLRADARRAALAAGALGVLAGALLRAPLLWNPAAAPLGFALFGAVLAREGRRGRLARAVLFAALLALALHAREARAIVAHGQALTRALERGRPEDLLAALDARGDSVEALSAAARAAESTGDAREQAAAWSAVLARRPHRREALVQLGNALARAGDLDGARRRWRYALGLAPGDRAVLNNLMRAAAFAGDAEEALAWCARAGFEDERLVELACAVLRERAEVGTARRLLNQAAPRYRGLSAQGTFDLAATLEAEGLADRARVLRGLAQLEWARQHAAQGDPAAAVRSYRQALVGLAAERLRYELAAALALAGRPDEARRELPAAPHAARDLRDLPAWAGNALLPLLTGKDGGG